MIVSLPIGWMREMGIKQGDEVILTQQYDRLILTATRPRTKEDYKAVLRFIPGDKPENNMRLLIAYYLAGYNTIEVILEDGFKAEDRKWIKSAIRERLMGLEVVGESSNGLTLQSFLNYADFPLKDAIISMREIITSMQEDAMKALKHKDVSLAQDVAQRDNEVDRFYLLMVRQLKAAILDLDVAEKIGIEYPRDLLGYRLIAKSMERIGDHAYKIAKCTTEIENEISDRIYEIRRPMQDVFLHTIEALLKKDVKMANEVINEAQDVVNMSKSLSKQVLDDTNAIEIESTLQSLSRIAEYSADIAEIVINMYIGDHY